MDGIDLTPERGRHWAASPGFITSTVLLAVCVGMLAYAALGMP